MSRELSPPDFVTARPLDEVGRLLLVAAGLIRRHGLAKYRRQQEDGSMCLHGAISMAADGDAESHSPLECQMSMRVVRHLRSLKAQGVGETGVAMWNNHPSRTADMVIAALESAAWSAP